MIVSTVTASGQGLDLNVVEVTTQATGVVKELLVKEGDTVRAGDKLLTLELDQDGVTAKEKAWAAYLGARAELDAAEQNALSAQGSIKAAEIELENAKQSKLALQKELKLAEASLIAAQREWEEIQSGSGASEAQRKQKELALQAAQEALTLAQRKYENADDSIERAALELSMAKQRAGSGSDAVAKAAANVTVAWAAYAAALPTVTAPVSGKVIGLNVVAGAAVKGGSSGSGSTAASTSSGYKVASILLGNLRLASFNVSEVDISR
jgi:multidrug resistance efflux pump